MGRGRIASDSKFKDLHIALVGKARVDQLEAMAAKPFKMSAAELSDLARKLMAEGEALLAQRVSVHIPSVGDGTILL
jgi:hypothetical protein